VLQHLPERLGIRIAFGRAIVLDARQVLCRASRDEAQQLAAKLSQDANGRAGEAASLVNDVLQATK